MKLHPYTARGDLQHDEHGDLVAVQDEFTRLAAEPRPTHLRIHPDNVERVFAAVARWCKRDRRAARMARKRRRGWA